MGLGLVIWLGQGLVVHWLVLVTLVNYSLITALYEGRSINKLQNGAIPLIGKI